MPKSSGESSHYQLLGEIPGVKYHPPSHPKSTTITLYATTKMIHNQDKGSPGRDGDPESCDHDKVVQADTAHLAHSSDIRAMDTEGENADGHHHGETDVTDGVLHLLWAIYCPGVEIPKNTSNLSTHKPLTNSKEIVSMLKCRTDRFYCFRSSNISNN